MLRVPPLKPMFFVLDAVWDDLLEMPLPVRTEFGHALYVAQTGGRHHDAKMLHGFGAGVVEIVENHDSDTYRAVDVVRFEEAIYVLHVFKKKSTTGIKTPQRELDTIKTRLQRAQQLHEQYHLEQEEGKRNR